MPEPSDEETFVIPNNERTKTYTLKLLNKDGKLCLPYSRCQVFARLGRYYIVEQMSRAIEYRAAFLRTLHGIRSKRNDVFETEDDANSAFPAPDSERQVFNNSNATFFGESFTGSPRHLKKLAMNALTIVSELGRPTTFMTGTLNPEWKEIKEALLPGQTIYDCRDIACIVFRARLEKLVALLR